MQVVDEKLKWYQVCFHGKPLNCRRNANRSLDAFLEFVQGIYKDLTAWYFLFLREERSRRFECVVDSIRTDSNEGIEDITQRDLIKKFMYGMTIS